MVRVMVLREDTRGSVLWEGEMPQAPANGDVFRLPGRDFKQVWVLHERTWTPGNEMADVHFLAVHHGNIT
jgi:hypothetical protein